MFFEEKNSNEYELEFDIDVYELPDIDIYATQNNFYDSTPMANHKSHNYEHFNSYPSNNYSKYNYEHGKFLSPKEGLLKGNLITSEYKPYKNYKPILLTPRTTREVKLFKVYELDFAINDLNLYLDVNPRDLEAFELFKKYNYELKKAKFEFEKEFGPLNLNECEDTNYEWSKDPWPWMNDGGSRYV